MAVNSNFFNSNSYGVPCIPNSLSVAETSQSSLNQKTLVVVQWLSRIRSKLQELWSGREDAQSVAQTVRFYLTVSNDKQRLRANHVTFDDPEITDVSRSSLNTRLNQVLRELKNDRVLDEYPSMVGFWVELKS